MKPWELLLRRMWALVRDVIFAGFGLWLFQHEVFHPAASIAVTLALISVGVALTCPSAAEHIKAILPVSYGESAITSSSESSERGGSPPLPSPPSASSGQSGEPVG